MSETDDSRPKSDPLPRSLGHVMRVLRHAPPKGADIQMAETPYGTYQRVKDLAEVLDRTPGRVVPGRTPKPTGENAPPPPRPWAKVSHNVVSRLENSEAFDLWKVARYANWSGLPVSVIMLVQELSAHIRDKKLSLAKEIAAGAAEICKHVLDEAERLSGDEPGPGSDKKPDERELLVKRCKNKDSEDPKRDKLVLIVDELFRKYPKSALTAKRAEWKHASSEGSSNAVTSSAPPPQSVE